MDHEAPTQELTELATEESGLITAIVAFFDVEYVSPSQQTNELAKRARGRARGRKDTPVMVMRR